MTRSADEGTPLQQVCATREEVKPHTAPRKHKSKKHRPYLAVGLEAVARSYPKTQGAAMLPRLMPFGVLMAHGIRRVKETRRQSRKKRS